MLPYTYTYLFADMIIGFPLWVVLFFARSDLRHKILAFSILGGIAGPISEVWYIKDYWHPLTITGWPISIEDVLFGFFVGGIGSVVYEELFGKHFAKRHKRSYPWILLTFPLITFIIFLFSRISLIHLNSIYVSFIAFFLTTVVILYKRRDLFSDALWSGILGGIIFFVGYVVLLYFFPHMFERMWLLQNISGIRFYNIPFEELVWAFTYGLMAGPIYECYAGLAFVKQYQESKRKKRK